MISPLSRTVSFSVLVVTFLILTYATVDGFSHHYFGFTCRKEKISTILHVDATVEVAVAAVAVVIGGGVWLSGADERAQKARYTEWDIENKKMIKKREELAFIEPKDTWTEAELSPYDGSNDESGPILFAASGLVFNVWKGRHFYGPGCEYNIFAGRDATRLLAKSKLEEETEEEAKERLSIAERVALQGWIYTFKGKYEVVGMLEGFDPKTTSF